MYGDKSLSERQNFGQFFTPASLSIKMIEKFENLNGNVLDPCLGAGNLIAASIKAGADPKCCYGIELDPDILKIARERLSALGVPEVNLHLGDALIDECYHFSIDYEYNDPKKLKELQKKICKDCRK